MESLIYAPLCQVQPESLLPIWGDPEVIRYTGITKPCTVADIRAQQRTWAKADVFAVQRGKEIIGVVGCYRTSFLKAEHRIFYVFQKAVWGQGYATAATRWLLEFMFQKYRRCTIFTNIITDNVASEKLLQKLGFSCLSEWAEEHEGNHYILRRYELKKASR